MHTFTNCRTMRVTLGVMLTALAACSDNLSSLAPIAVPQPQFAVGDVLLVTNTSGGTDVGSLRWALSYVTGGEIVRFAPGLAGQTITLDTTIVLQGKSITIEGPSDGGITISGGGTERVFDISLSSGQNAVLRNLTIANGNAGTSGGAGILMRGWSTAWLTVENSTITGNVASTQSAIAGVSTVLINTTVSGNTATSTIGNAVVLSNSLTLVNSTIAHNAGAGVNSGDMVLRNSIISNNSGGNCTNSPLTNTYEGNNLSNDGSCGGPLEITIADPQLGPLADNGGPTRTHAISAGSPAINGGAACSVTVDQRYASRDAQCDLGAFEFADFTTVDVTMASSAAIDLNGWAVVTGTVQCSRYEVFDLRVRVHQSLKSGRSTSDVDAMATTPIACSTAVKSWSVSVGTSGQKFETGSAVVGVSTLNAEPWITPVSLSQTVKLFKGRK